MQGWRQKGARRRDGIINWRLDQPRKAKAVGAISLRTTLTHGLWAGLMNLSWLISGAAGQYRHAAGVSGGSRQGSPAPVV